MDIEMNNTEELLKLPEGVMESTKLELPLYLVYNGDDYLMCLEGCYSLLGVFTSYDDAKKYIEDKISDYYKYMDIMGGRLELIHALWKTYYDTKIKYDDGIMRPGDLAGLTVKEFDDLTEIRDILYKDVFGSYIIKKTKLGIPMKDEMVYKAILGEKGIEKMEEHNG